MTCAGEQGGANAGHTIYNDKGEKFALHLVPSGILHEGAICVVGNGVVVHLPSLLEEIEALEARGVRTQGRLLLSDRAQLLFDLHKEVDGAREAELAGGKIGTTKRGIGPAYASKATRNGLRVGDLRYPDMCCSSPSPPQQRFRIKFLQDTPPPGPACPFSPHSPTARANSIDRRNVECVFRPPRAHGADELRQEGGGGGVSWACRRREPASPVLAAPASCLVLEC